MKTRPRIRKTMLWGGVVVSVALAVLWLGSMVLYVGCEQIGRIDVSVSQGALNVSKRRPAWGFMAAQFTCERVDAAPVWWLGVHRIGASGWVLRVPLWMPLVASLGVTAAAWRLEVLARRRERIGKCASCGYDRAGLNAGAVCPECGAAHGFVGENR